MFSEVDITFNVQSNVNYPVRIDILGNPYNPLDTVNATTEYQWDVTSFTFTNESYVVIQYQINGAPTFSTYVSILPSQTIQGVVDALNGLGIGFFNTYTQLGQTYISTYNDNYTFGQLNIYAASLISPSFFYGTGFDAPVSAILTQSDGKIVCCGAFTTYNGTPVNGFVVRINTDGSIDNTFLVTTGFDTVPFSIAQQSDGKLVFVGGGFTLYNGNSVSAIVRLNTDGSYDSTFVQGTGITGLGANFVAIQPDQNIVIAGTYNMDYNGTLGSLIRILPNGTVDGTFTAGVVGSPSLVPQISKFVIQNDGKFVIIGDIDSYGGSGTVGYGIIRVNSNGTYDSTFATGTGFNNSAFDISIQADQKLLVGGSFTSYNATTCSYAIRLNTNGSVDSVFTGTSFDSTANSIIYLSDGKILVSGLFTTYNGISADGIVKLNSDTTIDTTWNYGSGFGGTGSGILTTNSAQNLYNIGGSFTVFDGTPANYIIQLTT